MQPCLNTELGGLSAESKVKTWPSEVDVHRQVHRRSRTPEIIIMHPTACLCVTGREGDGGKEHSLICKVIQRWYWQLGHFSCSYLHLGIRLGLGVLKITARACPASGGLWTEQAAGTDPKQALLKMHSDFWLMTQRANHHWVLSWYSWKASATIFGPLWTYHDYWWFFREVTAACGP